MLGRLNGQVLLVDAEPLARKLISRYLVAAGYVVRVSVDGLDAIGELRAGAPDLIISDLNMPRMSGSEFLNVVRKRFPQIPVIVISGAGAGEMPEGLAADAYFHKNELGLDQLQLTILALSRNPPLRIAPPNVVNKPAQARRDGERHYIIECEDCLREFSVPCTPHPGKDEKWTRCAHCGRAGRLFVADLDSPIPA